MPFNAEKALNILGSGILAIAGPQLIEGMFGEWVKTVTIAEAEEWVTGDKSLWGNLDPGWQTQLIRYGPRMGKAGEVIGLEWAIKITCKVNPALASLFLNWPEARQWFAKNVEELKSQVLGMGTVPSEPVPKE
jgi:hypothetical protein